MKTALSRPLSKAFLISMLVHAAVLAILFSYKPHWQKRRSKSVHISFDFEQLRVPAKRSISSESKTRPVKKKAPGRGKHSLKAAENIKSIQSLKPEIFDRKERETETEQKAVQAAGSSQGKKQLETINRAVSEPQPASAPDSAAEAEKKRAIDAFLDQILYRIEKAKHYPRIARRRKMKGSVKCKFVISRDGTVLDTSIINPCSFAMLNSAAIDAVKKGVPYPAFPPFLQEDTFTSIVDITFELK